MHKGRARDRQAGISHYVSHYLIEVERDAAGAPGHDPVGAQCADGTNKSRERPTPTARPVWRSSRETWPTRGRTSGRLRLPRNVPIGRLSYPCSAALSPRHPVWGRNGSAHLPRPIDASSQPRSPPFASFVPHDEPYSTTNRADHALDTDNPDNPLPHRGNADAWVASIRKTYCPMLVPAPSVNIPEVTGTPFLAQVSSAGRLRYPALVTPP